MIIKIGKAKDNDFIANDPHVSRHHARLIREDGGNLLLEDTGSTNGTFVNGAQIVKKRVTPTDHIRLGDSYVLNLSEVLKYNNDYSDEFAALKKVYDDYIQAKVKIQSSNQFKTRLFQSLPFALPGAIRHQPPDNDLCPYGRNLSRSQAVGQDSPAIAGYRQSI